MEPIFDVSLVKGSVIVFIGAPLCGKGTQSKLLSIFLGMPVISSGDVFREVASSESLLGSRLRAIMNEGLLVPNELVLEVFLKYLSDPRYSEGFILDGFVREMENLDTLNAVCDDLALKLLTFIHLQESSLESLITRLTARLEECIAKNITPREDDKVDVLQRRYHVFAEKTIPVLDHLRANADKYNLITINPTTPSNQTVFYTKEEIFARVKQDVVHLVLSSSSSRSLLDLCRLLTIKIQAHPTDEDIVIPHFLAPFFELSLQFNAAKRTGVARRIVFLVSANQHKLNEFTSIFDQYGIEVLLLPHELRTRHYIHLFHLAQQQQIKNVSVVAVLKEYTSLIRHFAMTTDDPAQYIRADIRDKAKVVHLSELVIVEYDKKNDVTIRRTFAHKTAGYIDMSRMTKFKTDVFGWDDIFIVKQNNWSFHQLKKLGLKVSSRDMNISRWVQEKIYYKSLTDLKFTPVHATRSIDFSIDVFDFLNVHAYYINPAAKQCGILNLFHNVINTGLYFRSPLNRRLKNYWCPGLNAGIPLVPKKDEIHEATYMAHDFGHFGLPDLIFTGRSSPLHKLVYITWRMLSESMTIVYC